MKTIPIKRSDWSLNVEDPYYAVHPEELLRECEDALRQTAPGCYVNIVTPGELGDPREWLMAALTERFELLRLPADRIVYIDQCGCGGHVTRVYARSEGS